MPQKGFVGCVLEQPPHQVGHAGDELADRGVLAKTQAPATNGLFDGLAHAVQHLDLEGVVGEPELARRLDDGGQRAHVVAGEGRPDVRGFLQHRPRQLLVHGVGVGLVREDRHRPAFLRGEHRLVVPVRALDEPEVEHAVALSGPRKKLVEVALGVAKIGLQHDPGVVVAAELLFVEQGREHAEREVAVAELLEVEGEGRARLDGLAEDGAQALLHCRHAAGEVHRVDLRVQRGDLDTQVDPRQGAPGAVVDHGLRRPARSRAGEAVEQGQVRLLVGVSLGFAD